MPKEDTQFKKGNPGGPGRVMPANIRDMFDAGTPKAVQRWSEAMDAVRVITLSNGDTLEVPDMDLRFRAAQAWIQQRYGKPPQAITGEDGKPFSLGVVVLPSEGEPK